MTPNLRTQNQLQAWLFLAYSNMGSCILGTPWARRLHEVPTRGYTVHTGSPSRNHHAVQDVGGTAYIPFKDFSTGTRGHHKPDALWEKMWHFYTFNRETFLEHYHKRSNVESAFSMIKAKFGGAVRAKSPVAQVNEVLCKVLAHNICVLIQSVYELGLEPTFWGFGAKEPVAPKQFSFAGF